MRRVALPQQLSMKPAIVAVLALGLAALLVAQEPERVYLDAIGRIKAEGFQHSQAMNILAYIAEVCGPRLTGSPYRQPAADYLQKTLTDWGLTRVHTEPFSVGRGWAAERFSAHVISGQPWPLTGYSKAWAPGTTGTVQAEAVLAVLEKESDFEPLRGKLKGKFALIVPPRETKPMFEPVAWRHSPADLATFAEQPDPTIPVAFGAAREKAQAAFRGKVMAFLVNEGVACAFDTADRGVVGATQVMAGGSPDAKAPPVPCQVALSAEHYNRLFRMLEQQVTPTIEMTVQNRFVDDGRAFNIIAELPGTDKADELVILGAHWDSWHAGTGGLDDGAGVATSMEAMRILKATRLPLRRTVRLVLFDGEEAGLLGSQAYVRAHVAEPETMTLKSEHEKITVYLNADQGGGLMRGLGLNGNEPIAPVFAKWMEPFRIIGMGTLSPRMTGGGDHVPFDAVGIPAFEFLQDWVEYRRTLHTNQDRYDRVPPADVMQNAVILASFAYHAANREARMPRKPLPTPQQARDRWGLY